MLKKDFQQQVHQKMKSLLKDLPPSIYSKSPYLLKGKKLRSNLMYELAKKLNCPIKKIILPAVALELIHTISLIHDDVIDDQSTRRGQQTIHHFFEKKTAIYVGDFLLYNLMLEINRYTYSDLVIDIILKKILELCKGETLQDFPNQSKNFSKNDCFNMIKNKTGSLFSVTFIVPFLLVTNNSSMKNLEQEILINDQCGKLFGLTFQLIDDVDDLFEDLVKHSHEDLQGSFLHCQSLTYPTLLWKQQNPVSFKKFLIKKDKEILNQEKVKIQKEILKEISQQLAGIKKQLDKLDSKTSKIIFSFLSLQINKFLKSTA